MNHPQQVALGQFGSVKITSDDGTVTSGSGKVFAAITAITAVDLESGTAAETGFAVPSSIPVGATIFGRFTGVNLGTGSQEVIAYYDK